jgi:hypothetical protein
MKKTKLADDESVVRIEESCALRSLEEIKLEVKSQKVLNKVQRAEERLKLEQEKMAMDERE